MRDEPSVAEHAVLADLLPGYELGDELGRGSCGVVLAGYHRELEREVAIKRLPRILGADPELRARFVSEARLLASLDHPHIVRIYDFVEVDGVCAVVMQRLTGGTIWDRLERGDVDPRGACAVTVATCSALQYAHARGVLHRDIKPQNLMLSDEGVPKVTDFGIAKVLRDVGATTESGRVFGTPAYIAPEQAQGVPPGPGIDIYAAGVVLYVLLCGELPFPPAADAVTELYQHVHGDPIPLLERDPDAPAALADVTACALSRNPGERYASARDFAIAVDRAARRAWGPDWAAYSGVVLLGAQPTVDSLSTPPHGVAVRAAVDDDAVRLGPGDALYVAGADESLVDQLYFELAAGPRDADPSRLRVLCRLAIEMHLAGAPLERCEALIAEAEAILEKLDDPVAGLLVRYSKLVSTWSPDDPHARLASADELIARARQLDAADMAFRARKLRLRALLEAGDDTESNREIAMLNQEAAEIGTAWHRWQATLCLATRALRDGDADEAHGLMLEACDLGEAVEPDLARRCFDDQASRHRWLVGAAQELVPGLREAAESCPWLLVRHAALAFGLADLGRKTEAIVQFEQLAYDGFASVPRDANWLTTMTLLALACARIDDRPRALILHEALAPHRDRFAVAGDCTVIWGPVAAGLEALAPLL